MVLNRIKAQLGLIVCIICTAFPVLAQSTQPLVAIHDSELTRALESMNASGNTPTGAGATGKQWWPTNWHYFVMPTALKEMLRSDGTAFTVIGDSNIISGILTNANGTPKYPIVISLASEAIDNNEAAQLTNYVAAGGFLFVGSSAFTRNTNGTTRTNFAIADAMGINMASPTLTNWYLNSTISRVSNNRLVADFPSGTFAWQMPSSADEISWPTAIHLAGETPNGDGPGLPHMVWQVQSSNATVVATGDGGRPYLMVRGYGKGYFIYVAAMQPLLGHGSWSPGMYTYSMFRNAIIWAFESARLPVVKHSPWPYPYDAAVIFRHDMEAIPGRINLIENSALFESTNGASGDYYFCTGTLRLDMPTTKSNTIASLQRAVTNYGAGVYAHNGGLTNINPAYNPPLTVIENVLSNLLATNWLTAFFPYTFPVIAPLNTNGTDYDYWHWGPDEVLNVTNLPAGFTNGTHYAFVSLSNSFADIEGWKLTNGGPRAWCSPYFNATREASLQIQEQLGVKVTGDDKLSPFPHWVFSKQTPDKYYPMLSQPVSDWFIGGQVAQSMENGHTPATVQALVDFYYNMGALINLYNHSSSAGDGPDGTLPTGYVTYSLSKPRMWSANAARIYNWWLQRSNAQVVATYTNIGNQSSTTLSVIGESNTNAAVEILAPSASYSSLQVYTNGVLAGANAYRTNGQVIKVFVGTSVSNAVINYEIAPAAQSDSYIAQKGSPLIIAVPGVLTNDTAGVGGASLTAILTGNPANGSLTFNTDGSFTYTPTNNFTGMDGFTYQAIDGSQTSSVAIVAISVVPPGQLYYDTFARTSNTNSIFPWVAQIGAWGITNNQLIGTSPTDSYGYAFYNGNWTNYSVQAQIRFSSTNRWGGGIGGRLNPTTGAHYALWILPEGSPGGPTNGSPVWQLIKYQNWVDYTLIADAIPLPPVGTNAHTVKLTFQGNGISAYFDGALLTNVTDNGSIDGQPAYSSGAINVNLYTVAAYTMAVDDVIVSSAAAVANDDTYVTPKNGTLRVSSPGVLANDSGGGALTAILASGPSNGALNLTNNGGFSYVPTTNFTGTDSFTYRATDNVTTSSVATVTITVTNILPVANNDSYGMAEGTTLSVPAAGVLANDAGNANLTALLVTGPSHGVLNLTNNGGFRYTPTNSFVGADTFTYQASDGATNSAPATVTLTVLPVGTFYFDDFTRTTNGSILPWVAVTGTWSITNGHLDGTGVLGDYANAYLNHAPWTNYSVQARVRFSITNGPWGGGIGGRVNTNSGAHYGAWVYPEGSGGGPTVLKLIKYTGWEAWSGTPMATADLSVLGGVGTNWHTLKMTFLSNQISVYYDGNPAISVTDNNYEGSDPFTNGTISADLYTFDTDYTLSLDDVVVAPILNVPIANNDTYQTPVNTRLNVSAPGILANDTSDSGTNLTAVLVSGTTNGTLNLTNNGGFSYTPTNSFTGIDGFTYQASDGLTNSATASVTITVTTVNNPPLATNSNVTTPEDTATNLFLLGGDPDGPVTFTILNNPTNGTLTNLNVNTGAVTYRPSTNYNGVDTFRFTVSDGSLLATGTVNVTITSVNDAPIAADQAVQTIMNMAANLTLQGADADNANLTFAILTNPTNGALGTLNTNSGAVTYTPDVGYTGPDGFRFTVSDGSLLSTGTVSITISPAGAYYSDDFTRTTNGSILPWIAVTGDWSITNGELDGAGVLGDYANAYLDHAPWADYAVQARVRFSITNGPWGGGIGGRVNTNDGAHYAAWLYPEGSGGGSPLLRLIKYTGWETWSGTAMATSDLSVFGGIGTNWHTLKMAFLSNQISVYYDGNLAISVADNNYEGSDPFTNGTISADLYTFDTDYTLALDDVVVSPLVGDDSYAATEDTPLNVATPGVLGNDISMSGSNLTAVLVSGPVHGIFNLTNNGGFSYTPTNNFNGSDSFTYSAIDQGTNLGTGTVTITITAINDAPTLTLASNNVTVLEDRGLVTLNGFASATTGPTNESAQAITNIVVLSVSNATLFATNPAISTSGTLTFTPAANSNGVAAVTVQARDNGGTANGGTNGSTAQTFTITITAVNDAPTLTLSSNNVTVLEDSGLVTLNGFGSTTTGPANESAQTVTNIVVLSVSNATLFATNPAISTSETLTFTPAANSNGVAAVTVQARDNGGTANGGTNGSTAQTFTVTVTAVNDTPIANNQSLTNTEDTTFAIILTGSDIDGPLTNYTVVAAPTNGVLSGVAPNLSYRGATNYFGPDSFSFVRDDGSLTSAVATVSITLNAVNDAPVLRPKVNRTIAVGKTLVVNNAATDVDTLPNLLNYTLSGPAGAMITNGVISWTPSVAQAGTSNIFTTVVTDDGGLSATNAFAVIVSNYVFEITSIVVTNGTAIVTWDSLVGQTYRLQYKNNLADKDWIDIASDVTADGLTASATNVLGSAVQRFYRVSIATAPAVIEAPNQSIVITSGTAIISWDSVPGQPYRVQYKDNLANPNWTDIVPDVMATGLRTSTTNSLVGGPRYCRVIFVTGAFVSAPVLQSIGVTNGIATVSWSAIAGRTYKLQYKTNLSDVNWSNLVPDIVASGPIASATNAVGDARQKYYRVGLLP